MGKVLGRRGGHEHNDLKRGGVGVGVCGTRVKLFGRLTTRMWWWVA